MRLEGNGASSRSCRNARKARALLYLVAITPFLAFVDPSRWAPRQVKTACAGAASMTVAVLKEKLREKGLPTTGLKSALVQRLEEHAFPELLVGLARAHPEAATSPSGYSRLTVSQLKEKLSQLGLTKTGRKAELVARLEAARQASPAAASARFRVGDKVMAMHTEGEREAVVQCNNGDGSFLILWQDGLEQNQKADDWRLIQRADKAYRYSAGDKVEALYHEEETWYPARVKSLDGSGTYTIMWEEDGCEYELEEKDMKPSSPPIRLADLRSGQKFQGIVDRTFSFGTFVDIGAERNGILRPWFTYDGEEPHFKQGDKVQALYEDDKQYYPATVQQDNGDGTFLITWDEDDSESVCKKADMELLRLAELEDGSKVEAFVESVTEKDGRQILALALVEDKIGTLLKRNGLKGFELAPDQWLTGKVGQILPFGAYLEVTSPEGDKARGLLHIRDVRAGYIPRLEDELSLDEDVQVRVKHVDVEEGVLHLSMMAV